MNSTIFWVVTLCNSEMPRHFGEIYCLNFSVKNSTEAGGRQLSTCFCLVSCVVYSSDRWRRYVLSKHHALSKLHDNITPKIMLFIKIFFILPYTDGNKLTLNNVRLTEQERGRVFIKVRNKIIFTKCKLQYQTVPQLLTVLL
jgi:hypothetical protein